MLISSVHAFLDYLLTPKISFGRYRTSSGLELPSACQYKYKYLYLKNFDEVKNDVYLVKQLTILLMLIEAITNGE